MSVENKITALASKLGADLRSRIDARVVDMEADDNSHYLIYRVLGIALEEGKLIDIYQNKGRFLYKYAGSFLEGATKLCFMERFPEARSVRIPNTIASRPRTFEIDCLVNNDAVEIKWRDATTDGDHITKEHMRLQNIADAGYRPIRVMFYYPNRTQAIRIQQALETLYRGAGGEYHYGSAAWSFVSSYTGIDLEAILNTIATKNFPND